MKSEFIKNCGNTEKYIAKLNEDENKHFIHSASEGKNYCIIIGPEGDFSTSEILIFFLINSKVFL